MSLFLAARPGCFGLAFGIGFLRWLCMTEQIARRHVLEHDHIGDPEPAFDATIIGADLVPVQACIAADGGRVDHEGHSCGGVGSGGRYSDEPL